MRLTLCYTQKLAFGDSTDARSETTATIEMVNLAFRVFKKDSLSCIHLGNYCFSWKSYYANRMVEIRHYVNGNWNDVDITELQCSEAQKFAWNLVNEEGKEDA